MPREDGLTQISVTSIHDFMKCPLRWCFRWLENRVPRSTPTALDVGKVVHKAFERYYSQTMPGEGGLLLTGTPLSLQEIFTQEVNAFQSGIYDAEEQKALDELKGLIEPMQYFTEAFPFTRTLEVEQSFEFFLASGAKFRGRPDRVAVWNNKVWHVQTKTMGASVSPGDYLMLAERSLHELIYGRYLKRKYGDQVYVDPSTGERTHVKGLEYGGSIFNVVRKLKYRSKQKLKAFPEGKILHSPDEIFFQAAVGLNRQQEELAFDELSILSMDMDRVADKYLNGGMIVPNRMADSYYGTPDPYFYVIMGERELADDKYFMDREETY